MHTVSHQKGGPCGRRERTMFANREDIQPVVSLLALMTDLRYCTSKMRLMSVRRVISLEKRHF
jgi:hypothetical protein